MAEFNPEEGEKSKFNMALANLERLDSFITTINIFLFEGNYNSAYRAIRLFKGNLNPHIQEKDKKKIDILIMQISGILEKYNSKTFNFFKERLSTELFHTIVLLEENLIQVMQDDEMFMPRKDDAAHVMLR